MSEDNIILSLYSWVSTIRFKGASAQETQVLLGRNAEDAHVYKSYQHVQRSKARSYKPLPFPERYIEEIEVITMTLDEVSSGAFKIRPQAGYVLDRMRFKYIEGLHIRYHITQNEQNHTWRYLAEENAGSNEGPSTSESSSTSEKVLTWNAELQRWHPPISPLPWFITPFRGEIISNPIIWPTDHSKIAFVVSTKQGTIQVGSAQVITRNNDVYPVIVAETLIGTLDAALIMKENNTQEDGMAFARLMANWANTTTVLALLENVPSQEAANLTHMTQS